MIGRFLLVFVKTCVFFVILFDIIGGRHLLTEDEEPHQLNPNRSLESFFHELKNYRISSEHKSTESDETQVRQSQCCDRIAGRIITN